MPGEPQVESVQLHTPCAYRPTLTYSRSGDRLLSRLSRLSRLLPSAFPLSASFSCLVLKSGTGMDKSPAPHDHIPSHPPRLPETLRTSGCRSELYERPGVCRSPPWCQSWSSIASLRWLAHAFSIPSISPRPVMCPRQQSWRCSIPIPPSLLHLRLACWCRSQIPHLVVVASCLFPVLPCLLPPVWKLSLTPAVPGGNQ